MNDFDFQFQASCGRYPHTPAKKIKVKGELVQREGGNRRTDTTDRDYLAR